MALLKGTLDVLVLKTLSWGPMHGFEITSWLEARSGGRLEHHRCRAAPGAPPPRGARPSHRRVGRNKKRPPSPLLQPDRCGPRPPARRDGRARRPVRRADDRPHRQLGDDLKPDYARPWNPLSQPTPLPPAAPHRLGAEADADEELRAFIAERVDNLVARGYVDG